MLFFLLSLFVGCEQEQICTTEAIFAVNIELVDASGAPVSEAQITYTLDGDEGDFVYENGDGHYALGSEKSGKYDITIEASIPFVDDPFCRDFGSAQLSVEVDEKAEDDCHITPQSISPELEWVVICEDTNEE